MECPWSWFSWVCLLSSHPAFLHEQGMFTFNYSTKYKYHMLFFFLSLKFSDKTQSCSRLMSQERDTNQGSKFSASPNCEWLSFHKKSQEWKAARMKRQASSTLIWMLTKVKQNHQLPKLCKAFSQIFQNNLNVPTKIFSSTQWLTNVLKTTL